MAETRWSFPNGADSDTLTAALAGADTTSFTGGTAVLSNDYSLWDDGLSALMTSTASGFLMFSKESLSMTSYAVDMLVYYPTGSLPAADNYILWTGSSSTSRAVSVMLRTAGTIRLASFDNTNIYTSTGTIPMDTKVRISLLVTCSDTTGTGRVQVFDWTDDPATPVIDSTLLTGLNTGTGADRIRVGRKAATGTDAANSNYVLSWAYDPVATDFIPTPTEPAVSNVTYGTHVHIG